MLILVLNCGSSSVKFAVFDLAALERGERGAGQSQAALLEGHHERLGSDGSRDHAAAIADVLDQVATVLGTRSLAAVGHRVVHGGPDYVAPVLVDDAVLGAIDAASAVAPLHNPFAVAAMRAVKELDPAVPQIASFDTAFHSNMPRRAVTYAIDQDVARAHDIKRYGFHGLSHEYVSGVAAGFLQRPLEDLRLVTLHLGNGASACAVEYGRSAETSMGATPLEGLVMGTRSGDVDAGALLALLRSGFDVDALEDLLNRRSGLAGLSGLSGDVREIEEAAAAGDDRARLAINVFAHRVRKYVGAYAAAMGGLDAIVFTGGIGENGAAMRARILQRLEFLGVHLDLDRNRDASKPGDGEFRRITTDRSRVEALVVRSNEELMIARHVAEVLQSDQQSAPSAGLSVPIAISARHCHLSEKTFAALFGAEATPTVDKPLSQPGQFACKERVNLIGPRARIDNVRVLGPLRAVDQIEIARTDEFRLGVDAPVRDSGQVSGSAPITLEGPAGTVTLEEGLICARRHIHMHPDDAARFGVADRDEVSVAVVGGPRDLVFGDVLIRVKDSYALEMHIDTDEANAAEIGRGASGVLAQADVDDDSPALERVSEAHAELGMVKGKPGRKRA
jgi:acetate kinase